MTTTGVTTPGGRGLPGDRPGDRAGAAAVRRPLPTGFSGVSPRRSAPGRVSLVHPRRRVHSGTGLAGSVVDCALYSQGSRRGGRLPIQSALEEARKLDGGFAWIGLHDPDAESLLKVADEFGLHPLPVEDALYAHQRPKLETYGDTIFVVLKTLHYVDPTADSEAVSDAGELMIFIGPDFVVTVRHGEPGGLREVRADLEARPELLAVGPTAVLYAVVDRVVDDYGPVLEALEVELDEIETAVFAPDRRQPTERIHRLKREVIRFRRAVEPLVPVASELSSGDLPGLPAETRAWFRDIDDHVVHAAEHIAAMNEVVDSVLSSNVAQVSIRQNEDTRRISAWVAIAGVCTLIAGVYGMNFVHMPELGWALGYPYALALMAVASASLYAAFKRNHWL